MPDLTALSPKTPEPGVANAEVMRVVVEPPVIDGETVTFRWSQSLPNRFQDADGFFFRYEGIELARYSVELFYEIFLSLQLRVFASYDEQVDVIFPTPVPRPTVAYWTVFHDADNVRIGPIADVPHYSPWSDGPAPLARQRKHAIFFGGGKDSTLATCLFSEMYGADETVLIQFVGPMRPSKKHMTHLEHRQDRLMLQPAREHLGVATQRAWTDYQAWFRRDAYEKRPHLEFYTAGSLPLLLAWGVSLSVFSLHWIHYRIEPQSDGELIYRYARSRPEMLATQSTHYERAFGAPVTLANVTLPFSIYAAFRLLAERYPPALESIVMCTMGEVDNRWCLKCKKCVQFLILSLATGYLSDDFDYDRFLTDSPFVEKLNAYAETGVEPTSHGNVAWQQFLGGRRTFVLTCHLIAKIDHDLLPLDLSLEARANLALLKAMFGNSLFSEQERIPRDALGTLPGDLCKRLTAIAAEHFEFIDRAPGPHLDGDVPVTFAFDGQMPTRTSAVDHIRGGDSV